MGTNVQALACPPSKKPVQSQHQQLICPACYRTIASGFDRKKLAVAAKKHVCHPAELSLSSRFGPA